MPEEQHARLFDVLLPALRAGAVTEAEQLLAQHSVQCYATTPYLADRWELDDSSIPDGSVAVITLEGPLYSWETFRLETYLRQAADNPRILGVVLWINGPGGMALYVDVVAKIISEYTKPIATFVAGYMLSAHFWIGSSTGRIFISSPLVEVGSVGTMATYVSMKEYYKQLGFDVRDIYPDTADLKNKWFRDIEERDDDTILKAKLQQLHQAFAQAVAKNLSIDYDPQQPLFRGETFTGEEALTMGVVQQQGTLLDAVQWVVAQSTLRQIQQ